MKATKGRAPRTPDIASTDTNQSPCGAIGDITYTCNGPEYVVTSNFRKDFDELNPLYNPKENA